MRRTLIKIKLWNENTNLRNQIDDWAGDTNSVAQFTAKTIKEIVDHQVKDLPDMVEPYFIPEIDVRPSDAANKRGYESIDTEQESDETFSQLITASPNPFDGMSRFERVLKL